MFATMAEGSAQAPSLDTLLYYDAISALCPGCRWVSGCQWVLLHVLSNKACSLQVRDLLGEPIVGYGEESGRGRRRDIL